MNSPRKSFSRGFSLIELLVYIGLLATIVSLGFVAMYHAMDNSVGLHRSADATIEALRAGETWRAELRLARTNGIEIQNLDGEQILLLRGTRTDVSYRFAENNVYRRIGTNDWSRLLKNVKSSDFILDRRRHVVSCRWELELETFAKKKNITSIRPMFTFTAVPGTASNP